MRRPLMQEIYAPDRCVVWYLKLWPVRSGIQTHTLWFPDVGLYEHFQEASSVAVYIEAYYEETKTWKRTRLYHIKPLDRMAGIGPNNSTGPHYIPEGYQQVKRILQMLEGTQLEWTNIHFSFTTYSVKSMIYTRYNHLQQTVEMVDIAHPRVTKPLPKLMTFQENSDLMFQKYPSLIIGPTQKPGLQVLLPNTPMTSRQANTEKCDFCLVVDQRNYSFAQCRDSTVQCQVCLLYLNRPCTWTDRPTVKKWQAEGDPQHLFCGPIKIPKCEDIPPLVGSTLLIESLDEEEEEG